MIFQNFKIAPPSIGGGWNGQVCCVKEQAHLWKGTLPGMILCLAVLGTRQHQSAPEAECPSRVFSVALSNVTQRYSYALCSSYAQQILQISLYVV